MKNIKLLIITIILIVFSPWFFSFLIHPESFNPQHLKIITAKDQFFIDEINYLRGLTMGTPIYIPSRIVVNKHTMFGKKLLTNYFETYDPKFLFFEGEDDLKKTPFASGPLLMATIPFFIAGILFANKKQKKWAWLLFISTIPAAFIEKNFDTTSRIAFFVLYAALASHGFYHLFSKRRLLFFIMTLFLVINFSIFYHNFATHHPTALSKQDFRFK